MTQFTKEELKARLNSIGGSDAGAVLGLSPYKTPLDIYLEKTGEIEPPNLSDKEAVRWGNILEDVIAEEFTARTGIKTRRVNRLMQHPVHHFMTAHIDRKIEGKPEGLEIKTAGFFLGNQYGEEGTDQIPDHYLAQVLHYLAVTGYERFHVAALIGGQRLWIGCVERDGSTKGHA